MSQRRFDNGFVIDIDGADVTGGYDATEYAVYLSDDEGEITSWVGDEWIADPTIVASILNATLMGIQYGPKALRSVMEG